MYSHEDKDKFATMITLIATVPFALLFIIALICICASL
jgi:hypothetical protein